jgi:hypothetical protein
MAAKHSLLQDDKAMLSALSVRWRTLRSQPDALRCLGLVLQASVRRPTDSAMRRI